MRQPEFRGALRLMFGELAKVVVESIRRTAIEPSPECWLADGLASGGCHSHIIVRNPADHVRMRLNVFHGCELFCGSRDFRFKSAFRTRPGATRRLRSSGWNWLSSWIA